MTPAPIKYYSQNEEERFILEAVGVETGVLLEIGAYHPTCFSNSRALIERGWGALLIEPSPEPFLGLLKEYGTNPRVNLICAAVANEGGLVKLHATADALSTTSDVSFEKWKAVGGFYGSFWTPALTIPSILNQFGAFDFVSVDSEGTSVDLFADLLKTAMRPRALCVEHDGRLVECGQLAQNAGYKQVYVSGENCVYSLR